MRSNPLGRSGVEVSAIGFGAWGIGGATPGATSYGRTDDRVSLEALLAARDAGITLFDTAPVYGYGHSEELIGQAFAGRRDDVVIATKAGVHTYGVPADFSAAAIRTSLEGSLGRLGTDYVDVLQLHNPAADVIARPEEILAAVAALRTAGKVRAFGVSVRTPEDGLAAIEHLAPNAMQVNFNLLDQRIVDGGLLERARAADCAIIARTPLCFGFLSGDITTESVFAEDDHRSRWPREQVLAWIKGAADMRAQMEPGLDQTPAQFALRFCGSHPGVATAIPGILTAEEARDGARAAGLGPIAPAVLERIRGAYDVFEFSRRKPSDPGKVDGGANGGEEAWPSAPKSSSVA